MLVWCNEWDYIDWLCNVCIWCGVRYLQKAQFLIYVFPSWLLLLVLTCHSNSSVVGRWTVFTWKLQVLWQILDVNKTSRSRSLVIVPKNLRFPQKVTTGAPWARLESRREESDNKISVMSCEKLCNLDINSGSSPQEMLWSPTISFQGHKSQINHTYLISLHWFFVPLQQFERDLRRFARIERNMLLDNHALFDKTKVPNQQILTLELQKRV